MVLSGNGVLLLFPDQPGQRFRLPLPLMDGPGHGGGLIDGQKDKA
jgi:hypothetical protein